MAIRVNQVRTKIRPEILQMNERFLEALLHDIFGVLSIACHALNH